MSSNGRKRNKPMHIVGLTLDEVNRVLHYAREGIRLQASLHLYDTVQDAADSLFDEVESRGGTLLTWEEKREQTRLNLVAHQKKWSEKRKKERQEQSEEKKKEKALARKKK